MLEHIPFQVEKKNKQTKNIFILVDSNAENSFVIHFGQKPFAKASPMHSNQSNHVEHFNSFWQIYLLWMSISPTNVFKWTTDKPQTIQMATQIRLQNAFSIVCGCIYSFLFIEFSQRQNKNIKLLYNKIRKNKFSGKKRKILHFQHLISIMCNLLEKENLFIQKIV